MDTSGPARKASRPFFRRDGRRRQIALAPAPLSGRENLNSLDIGVLALVAILGVKGAVRGFFREVFGLLALAAGVGASVRFGQSLAPRLAAPLGLDPRVARAAAHGVLFLCPYVGLQAVGFVLHRLSRAIFLGGLDRAGGALVGGLSGGVLAGGAALLLTESGWGGRWLVGSTLAGPLAEAVRRAAGLALGFGP